MNTALEQAQSIVAKWRHAPPVEVVAFPSLLPVPAPDDAAGLYYRGRIWLVDRPGAGIPQLIAHEALAHHGSAMLLGPHWRGWMRAISLGARSGDERLARLLQHVQLVYVDEHGVPCLSRAFEANELIARLAEIRANPQTALIEVDRPLRKRLAAAIGHFRRQVLHLDEPARLEEVEGLLLASSALVREGYSHWKFWPWWYAPRMGQSKPMGPKVPARSLRESEELLGAVRHREESSRFLKLGGFLLMGIIGLATLTYSAWDLLIAPFFR